MLFNMRSKIIAAGLALSALTLAAAPAFADDAKGPPSFPMPAATFKQHVDARMVKARAHMEERASKLSAADATALRTKFDANLAQVNAEVAKAIADGTVTKEEAHAVRAASPHGDHGKCDGKSGNKS